MSKDNQRERDIELLTTDSYTFETDMEWFEEHIESLDGVEYRPYNTTSVEWALKRAEYLLLEDQGKTDSEEFRRLREFLVLHTAGDTFCAAERLRLNAYAKTYNYVAVYHHRHGTSYFPFTSEKKHEEIKPEEIVEALELDFKENRGESIEIEYCEPPFEI